MRLNELASELSAIVHRRPLARPCRHPNPPPSVPASAPDFSGLHGMTTFKERTATSLPVKTKVLSIIRLPTTSSLTDATQGIPTPLPARRPIVRLRILLISFTAIGRAPSKERVHAVRDETRLPARSPLNCLQRMRVVNTQHPPGELNSTKRRFRDNAGNFRNPRVPPYSPFTTSDKPPNAYTLPPVALKQPIPYSHAIVPVLHPDRAFSDCMFSRE